MKESLRSTRPANLVVLEIEGCCGAESQLVNASGRTTKLKQLKSGFRWDRMVALLNSRSCIGL